MTVLLKGIGERDKDGTPEAQRRFDRQLLRQNVSQHLKPRNSNKTFRIYQHISLLLFLRNWHPAAPDAHILHDVWKNPENFFCLLTSLFPFNGLISIKPCCFCKNQYSMETKKSKIQQHVFLIKLFFIPIFLSTIQLNYVTYYCKLCIISPTCSTFIASTSAWSVYLWFSINLFITHRLNVVVLLWFEKL